jgi:hypothetical protein
VTARIRLGQIVTYTDATGWRQADLTIGRAVCPACGADVLITQAEAVLDADATRPHADAPAIDRLLPRLR